MKVQVNEGCIMCGACVAATEGVIFKIEGASATVIKQPETPDEEEKCRQAEMGCPLQIIKITE